MTAVRIEPGDLLRYRETSADDWVYAEVTATNGDSIRIASRQRLPRGRQLRETIRRVDAERMLVEGNLEVKGI